MKNKIENIIFFIILIISFASCNSSSKNRDVKSKTIQLTSSAFAEGASIPLKYTCDGEDISPPLKWSNVPPGAKSIALICNDPDAPMGTWTHWVLYGLPPTVLELQEGIARTDNVSNGSKQGINDFKRIGYGGPCPPPGNQHRYFFKLYALDIEPQPKTGITEKELEGAMQGHILGEGELMGTYKRK